MTLIIAHRGASAHAAENSLEAFRLAVEHQADAVEFDVFDTADGGFVVRHDARIAGRPLGSLRLDDIRRHRLPNGEAPPTLRESLAALGSGITAFVEVKALAPRHDQAFLACLDAAPDPGRCHVHAFDHRIVHRLRRLRSTLTCGVLSTSYPLRPLLQLQDAGATELWQEESLIDRELIDLVRGAGYRVYAWTADDAARLRVLRDLGVDGVCTNRPQAAREALR